MLRSKLTLAIICLAAAIAPQLASATATRITSYNALLSALKSGHRVMAVADNAKCTVTENDNPNHKSDGLPDPEFDSVVGINFSTNFFLKYRDFGDKRYHVLAIATNIGTLNGSPLHRLKQIKIYDDNTGQFYAGIADFQTGKLKGHIIMTCGISNGHDSNGMNIFDYDAVNSN